MHTKEGALEFKPSEKGLHYHDTSEEDSNINHMLVNTVRENFMTLPRQRKLEGFKGWWEILPTESSRGWYVKNLSPIAPSLYKTLRMLTVSLVLISPTLGGK